MTDNKFTNRDEIKEAESQPSIDNTTGQPIEEAEDNLSRHATKDSSPTVPEQGRTTEKLDEDQPRAGSETRTQRDEQRRQEDF
jgi:hypothetical protein